MQIKPKFFGQQGYKELSPVVDLPLSTTTKMKIKLFKSATLQYNMEGEGILLNKETGQNTKFKILLNSIGFSPIITGSIELSFYHFSEKKDTFNKVQLSLKGVADQEQLKIKVGCKNGSGHFILSGDYLFPTFQATNTFPVGKWSGTVDADMKLLHAHLKGTGGWSVDKVNK